MDYLAIGVMTAALVIGVGLTLLTLSGQWVPILAALGLLLAWNPGLYSWWTLVVAAVVALGAEVLEMGAGAVGAAKAGGGKKAALGAVVGALAGAVAGTVLVPVPVIGTVLGAVVGAGLAAAVVERGTTEKSWGAAAKVGGGAAAARLVAVLVKTGAAVIVGGMLLVGTMV